MAAAQLWPDGARAGDGRRFRSRRHAPQENLARNRTASVDARVGTLADAGDGRTTSCWPTSRPSVLIPLAPAFPARLAPGRQADPVGAAGDRRSRGRGGPTSRPGSRSRRVATKGSGRRCGSVVTTDERAAAVRPARAAGRRPRHDCGDEHRHLARVLRARPGSAVTLFDGAGGEVEARVLRVVARRDRAGAGAAPRGCPATPGAADPGRRRAARARGWTCSSQKTCELGVARHRPRDDRAIRSFAPSRGGARAGRKSPARRRGSAAAPTFPAVEQPIALAGGAGRHRASCAAPGPVGASAGGRSAPRWAYRPRPRFSWAPKAASPPPRSPRPRPPASSRSRWAHGFFASRPPPSWPSRSWPRPTATWAEIGILPSSCSSH